MIYVGERGAKERKKQNTSGHNIGILSHFTLDHPVPSVDSNNCSVLMQKYRLLVKVSLSEREKGSLHLERVLFYPISLSLSPSLAGPAFMRRTRITKDSLYWTQRVSVKRITAQ